MSLKKCDGMQIFLLSILPIDSKMISYTTGERLMFIRLASVAALQALAIALSLYIGTDWSDLIKIGVIASVFIMSALVYLADIVVPTIQIREDFSDELICRLILPSLVENYQRVVPGNYGLRGFVMRSRTKIVLRGKKKGIRKVLKITYSTAGFDPAEEELEWIDDMGAWGKALCENRIVYYDKQQAPHAGQNLPPIHQAVIAKLESILSAPIYRPNDNSLSNPIGVIGLDSEAPIQITLFDSRQNHGIVVMNASMIGSFMP